MAENNTSGAVHLTSLSLDLTQFNENIKQIETATANVADVSVQNLSKIRDALNIKTDKLTFSIDTHNLTQNVNAAKESVERLSSTVQSVSREISGTRLLSSDTASIEEFVRSLGIANDRIEESVMKLATLEKELDEYSKISVSTQGGELFRAIVISSDEAGQSIRKVIDLTQEVERITVDSAITITNNEKERASAIKQVNQQLINSLNEINKNYEKLSNTIGKSKLEDVVKQEFIERIREAQSQIKELKEQITGMNQIVPTEAIPTDKLTASLKVIASDFGIAQREQAKFIEESERAKNIVKQYEDLQVQIARLVSTMASSKLEGPNITEWLNTAKQLDETITVFVNDIEKAGMAEKGQEEIFRSTAEAVRGLNVELIEIRTSNNEYKNSLIPIQEQANATISTLKSMEQATSFKGYREMLSGLRSEYSSFARDLKNSGMSADEAKAKLAGLDNQFKTLSSTIITNTDEINNLALKYSNFANTLSNTKFSEDSGMKRIIAEAKDAEASLKQMAEAFSSGLFTAQDIGKAEAEFAKFTSRLTELKTEAKDAEPALRKLLQSADLADNLVKKYDEWQLKLAKIATSMSGFGLKMNIPNLDSFIAQANNLQSKARDIAQGLRDAGAASQQSESDFRSFEQQVNQLMLEFESAKKGANDYKQSLEPIQQQARETANALKALEKTATFKTQRNEVANLRAEYENFINRLKTTGMTAEQAQTELAGLDSRFQTLQADIARSDTVLGRFVNKLGETIKWRIANSAIMLAMRSFSGLTDTIIETENAVIELQRVLGDKNLVPSEMAQSLYDIAYQYGQTFDAVQESAVKFAQTGMDWEGALEATRVTMLGLNTAELDVSTATEGLIAVMSQFGIEAEDLEGVVDKINKTADNFPVTSEKIVSALQRAGGTARAFGMTLDETIGVITALGAATGRAGSAIGTALNSLITFSMKGSALEAFSDFIGKDVSDYKVLDVWKELSEAIKNAADEGKSFAATMATTEGFNELLNEDLASAVGLMDEYNAAQQETNDMLAAGKDIYSVVGAYRQNYFIALLNNIDMAIEAIQGMNTALGYSEQENLTAMEAFSKKWNQLVISAKELAIQFGNSGFLDFMKFLTESATGVVKLTKNVGGLNTVLVITSALLFSIKKQQIGNALTNVANTFTNFQKVMNAYNTAMLLGYTRTEALKIALSGLQLTAAGVIGVIGLAVTAVGALIEADKKHREEQRLAREETIANSKETIDAFDSISVAYKEYVDAQKSGNADDVKKARNETIQALGYEIEDINYLITLYGDEKTAIEELVKEKQELMRLNAKEAYEAITSEEKLKEVSENRIQVAQSDKEYLERLIKQGKDYSGVLADLDKKLEQSMLGMNLAGTEIDITPKVDLGDLDSLKAEINRLSKELEAYDSVMSKAEKDSSLLYQSTLKTKKAYEEYYVELQNITEEYENSNLSLEEYTQKVLDAKEALDENTASIEDSASAMKELGDVIEDINKLVDSFQSSYKTLTDVIDEYNQTGIMTADMLQSLMSLEPEYIQLLEMKNGTLSINKEKLDELIATNDTYLDQLVLLKVAEAIDNELKIAQAASTAGLTVEEYKLQAATSGLTSATLNLVKQLYDGQISTAQFKNEIAKMAQGMDIASGYVDTLANRIYGLTDAYKGFYSQLMSPGTKTTAQMDQIAQSFGYDSSADPAFQAFWKKRQTPAASTYNLSTGNLNRYYTPSSSKSSGGGSSKSEDPFKKEKEDLKELLAVYEHSILLLEHKKDQFVGTSNEGLQEALDAYNEEMRLVSEKNIDLTQTVFGNIDTNNRQVIKWTEENLARFKDAYESLGYTADELRDSISTIMGTSSEYEGVEIAYTPILQTSEGPKLLNQDTVDKYIWGLIEQMPEGWTNEDLLRLDTEGLEIDGQRVKNLIADIGESAIKTGEAMHYVGEMGSVNLAKQALEEARANHDSLAGKREYANQVVAIYKKMQEAVHAQAEKYRAAGLAETSEEIRELQKLWLQYQDKIEEIMQDVYEEIVGTYENAINYLEHLYESAEERLDYSYMGENLKKQLDYQVKIQREAERELERLAQKGIDVNDDAAQAVIDRWYEAEKAIREISKQIAADILEPYDDFIDLADKFDIWEYMDFTKVDYLRDKLAAVNKLLQEGTITLKQYNEELKNISYAIFDAQKELYEKQKDDINKQLKETTKAHKEEIDSLKKRKDELSDYYDKLIDGYNKEIDIWNKRKDEVSEYYDTLIENLRDVEKANERINKQLDYYNERQKIITNLEQAQARSGVEWREKEMEYQQQLIDLDEDWKRTLAEWDIEDQIAALEKLKETTLKDIELSIQALRDIITATTDAKNAALESIDAQIKAIEELIEAAEKAAEEEIQVIEDKIKDLSKTIAEAIKNGTEDGLVNSREELDKALVDGTNAMLEFIDTNEKAFEDGAKVTATNVFGIYKSDFIDPMRNSIDEIAGKMKNALTDGIADGAKEALATLQKNLIEPLRSEMSSIMKQASGAKQSMSSSAETTTKKLTPYQQVSIASGKGPVSSTPPSLKETLSSNRWENIKNPTQVFITNYNNTLDMAAGKTAQNLRNILGS